MKLEVSSKKIMKKIEKQKENIREIITTYKNPFIILSLIFFISFFSIIRANINYIDDIGRAAQGYKGWENFSRYLSNFLANFIHTDSYLTDVSPLPQIIAIAILSISGIMILHILSGKQKFSIWEIISIIPLGISPYFLGCISFKFDAPYMAISILASIFPLLYMKKSTFKYLISIIIGSLIMCMTYQASSGIFPMLVIILSLKMWSDKEDNKKILKFILISIIGYIIGLLGFKVFLMQPIDVYASNSVPSLPNLFPTIIQNLKLYFNYINNDLKVEWFIMIELICIGFVYVIVRKSKQDFYKSLIASIITIFLMLILSFGMYSVLEKSFYSPRAMYGFGAFIAIIGCYIMLQKKALLAKIIHLSLCWCFFVFCFTYGNALYVQKEYTNFRTHSVLNDIKDIEVMLDDKDTLIQISGTIDYAPTLNNMPEDYEILKRLVPITFSDSTYKFGRMEFANYYNLKNITWNDQIDLNTYNLPIIKDTMYHTIKGDNNNLLIILK